MRNEYNWIPTLDWIYIGSEVVETTKMKPSALARRALLRHDTTRYSLIRASWWWGTNHQLVRPKRHDTNRALLFEKNARPEGFEERKTWCRSILENKSATHTTLHEKSELARISLIRPRIFWIRRWILIGSEDEYLSIRAQHSGTYFIIKKVILIVKLVKKLAHNTSLNRVTKVLRR